MLQKQYNAEFDGVQHERKHGMFDELEKLFSENKQIVTSMKNGAKPRKPRKI